MTLHHIDPIEVEKLASYGCRTEEIADFFNCSHTTLNKRFQDALDRGRAGIKIKLRRWQLEAAEKGNPAILIWLGKQMLGQVDQMKLDITKVPDSEFMIEVQRRLKNEQEQLAAPPQPIDIVCEKQPAEAGIST